MKIATKLTKRVAEFVNENGIGRSDFHYVKNLNAYYHHEPYLPDNHQSAIVHQYYTEVSEQKFIDMVTAELAIENEKPKEMKTKCIVLGQENEPKPIVLKEIVTDQFTTIECNLNPSYFKKLIFDTRIKKFKGMDLIVGVSGVDRVLLLGHWNDGVV